MHNCQRILTVTVLQKVFVVVVLRPYVGQFRLVNCFDLEIVLSLSASFGKTGELNLLYYDNFP